MKKIYKNENMTLTIQILDISNEEMINRYTGVYFLLQLVDKTISSKLVVGDILKKKTQQFWKMV